MLTERKHDFEVLRRVFEGDGAPAVGAAKAFEWTLSMEALQALVDIIPHPDDTTRETWIDVLHGIVGAGGDFEMWDSYARRWHKYDAADTRKRWDTLGPANVRSGGGLLRKMAEEKNPKGFDAWRQEWEAEEVFDDDPPPVPSGGGGGLPKAQQLKYAQDIAKAHGRTMRWVLERRSWALFDGELWRHLSPGIKLAGQYAMAMAMRAPPKDKGEHDVTTLSFLDGVEGLCRQIPELQANEAEFDKDPWLLGTPGGTVDLRTGALRGSDPADMIAKAARVAPGGDCPRWKKFLVEVTKGDLESIAYLQQYAGYCLTGLTIEQVFLFLYGPGGNGKSVFVDMLAWLWNDYAVKPVADLFLRKAHGMGHTSKLAMLAGARLATASEVPAGAQWDEAFLKDVTGGGAITAGFKHRDEFTFVPCFKLLAYGNSQPTFPGGIDEAIKRRFRMMEFLFKPAVADLQLMDTLKKEGPGILQWAIEGCLAWQKTNLMTPQKVEEATAALFEGQDLVGLWLGARTEKSKGHFIAAADLFNDWLEFRNSQGERELFNNATAFGLEMVRRGLVKGRTMAVRGYQDVKLRSKAGADFDDLNE